MVQTYEGAKQTLSSYKVGNQIYHLKDITPQAIAGMLRKDKQTDIDPVSKTSKGIFSEGIPLGFYLADASKMHPDSVQLSYDYVTPLRRGQNLGLAQIADYLFSAIEDGQAQNAIIVPIDRMRSSFLDSMPDIVSSSRIAGWREYIVDLKNPKSKKVLEEKLKEKGVAQITKH